MEIPPEILERFPPSNQRLLDATRQSIDDEMLWRIANADYGIDADEYLDALRPIRDRGIVQPPLSWCPLEVLQLTTYSEPDKEGNDPRDPGHTSLRGHQIRAFACAALLRSGTEIIPSTEFLLAVCLASSKVLGDEINDAIACYLTWEFQQFDDDLWSPDDLAWLYAIGLFVSMCRMSEKVPLNSLLGVTATWVLAKEFVWQQAAKYPNAMIGIDRRWISHCRELIENASKGSLSRSIGNDLARIGELVQDRMEFDVDDPDDK